MCVKLQKPFPPKKKVEFMAPLKPYGKKNLTSLGGAGIWGGKLTSTKPKHLSVVWSHSPQKLQS